jgi:Ran GTPase-activating protein (RanGAP) involved in mRNA processing and transport
MPFNKGSHSNFYSVAKVIDKNFSLKILDVSWCNIGLNDNIEAMELLGVSLSKNVDLVHLDISQNFLCLNACKVLGKYIEKNNTLIGIHINNNDITFDCNGFITTKYSEH